MIELTSLVGKPLYVNHELIRTIEIAPDTILCFIDGMRLPVRETPEQVREKVLNFKRESLVQV